MNHQWTESPLPTDGDGAASFGAAGFGGAGADAGRSSSVMLFAEFFESM
jgi:hypothetical protein